MKARLLLDERHQVADRAFIAIRVWAVPDPVRGSAHGFKYSLAYIEDGVCRVRFDNEAGKGDHVHVGNVEQPYAFETVETLLADFRQAWMTWRKQRKLSP